MKRVFRNSSEVIHVFAQRTQDEGKCSNVFFHGDKIYSFGHHYLLGEFRTNANGELAIVINDKGYSATTSEHIWQLRAGTRQYKQFFTKGVNPELVLPELETLAYKLQNARKPELYILPAEALFKSYMEFQGWNGETNNIEFDRKIKELIKVFRGESYGEYLTRQMEIILKAQGEKIRREKLALKKSLKDFFDHKIDSVYRTTDEDYCRISKDGTRVETTQRVVVPIGEARLLYTMIKAGRDIKGHVIDGWTVIGLNGVLRIGCHRINRKNMVKIGEQILKMA
jgi:hypothetical protein